jgi:hypothetical protein
MIYAALFSAGVPKRFMHGSADQLNANIEAGGTWRRVSESITTLGDVPPLSHLEAPGELIEIDAAGDFRAGRPAPEAETLATVIAELSDQVNSERARRLIQPVTVNAISLDADAASQQSLFDALATLTIAGPAPSVQWVDGANNIIALTVADISAFCNAILDRRAAEFLRARETKDAIAAASTIAAAVSIFDLFISEGDA